MEENWISILEYARQHQLSHVSVRRKIKTGRLQAVLKDGKYFIPPGGAASQEAPEKKGSSPSMDAGNSLSFLEEKKSLETLEPKALVDFCRQVLDLQREKEAAWAEAHKAKEAKEAERWLRCCKEMELKDKTIQDLEQKLEDTQLLLEILKESSS